MHGCYFVLLLVTHFFPRLQIPGIPAAIRLILLQLPLPGTLSPASPFARECGAGTCAVRERDPAKDQIN